MSLCSLTQTCEQRVRKKATNNRVTTVVDERECHVESNKVNDKVL